MRSFTVTNVSPQTVSTIAPYTLWCGRQPRLPVDFALDLPSRLLTSSELDSLRTEALLRLQGKRKATDKPIGPSRFQRRRHGLGPTSS